MSGMNEFLAAHYGTGGASDVSEEDLQKQAQVELFAKLAADNNIDIASLSDEQVNSLWNDFQKQASGDAPEEKAEAKDEKKEEAKKEHEEKKEAAAKLAEADFLGRVMAHSYVDELKKIAAASESTTDKVASKMDNLRAAVGKHMERAGKGAVGAVLHTGGAEKAMDPRTAKAIGAGVHAAGAAAAGGAAVGAKKMLSKEKEKKSSAIDELAAQQSVIKAAEAGFDSAEAVSRISAVLTLGPKESEKIAQIQDTDQAVEVRSLELLEQAGYPVTWNQ